MKTKWVRWLVVLPVFLLSDIGDAAEVWRFGPARYTRSTAAPVPEIHRFSVPPGEGRITVRNGNDSGGERVSSARITLNGAVILKASDLNPTIRDVERTVALNADNVLSVELGGRPGSYITLRVTQESSFVESFPNWARPDLAITALTVTPERAAPDSTITLRATVENIANIGSGSASLVFAVDGQTVARIGTGAMSPGTGREFSTSWAGTEPGRHAVVARLEIDNAVMDRGLLNNQRLAVLRVSGETAPQPELVFDDIAFGPLQYKVGERAVIPLTVRNPGFAAAVAIPLHVLIDGVVMKLSGDDVMDPGLVLTLAPDGAQVIEVPWPEVTPGSHRITAVLTLPDAMPDPRFATVNSWYFVVNGALPMLCGITEPNYWTSLGPGSIEDSTGGLPTRSVGRIDGIAFHPGDPQILYAAAPSGGVWKTTDGGGSWSAVGDALESLNVREVAVDPRHPNVVYAGTFTGYGGAGIGIVKSVDGGATWKTFATAAVVGSVTELVLRYPNPGTLVIYAATDKGVLRYASGDPLARSSTAAEWTRIKSGRAIDIALHPVDPDILYASMHWNGLHRLWRTTHALSATGDGDWQQLGSTLPSTGDRLVLDVWRADPSVLLAAILKPLGPGTPLDPQPLLGLYRSKDGGDSWTLMWLYWGSDLGGELNIQLLRIHPSHPLAYFGSVQLSKQDFGDLSAPVRQVRDIHVDIKKMEFDPFDPAAYYVTTDGGVWRCRSEVVGDDSCVPRNNDLRTTQFFDLDVARGNASLMMGGTQDNGTIIYTGSSTWTEVKGGDGNMALFASWDAQVLYAQHQMLHDDYGTARCSKGVNCRAAGEDWPAANAGLPTNRYWGAYMDGGNDAWITAHPNDPQGNYLLSQGDEVYVTRDGGASWTGKGPKGTNVKGYVTRVVVQPDTFTWIAGTTEGQIWSTSNPDAGWTLLFEHPCIAGKCSANLSASVTSLAFAPSDHRVLYAVFDIRGSWSYMRLWRLEMNPGPPASWSSSNITHNFPDRFSSGADVRVRVIAGDADDPDIAYVGTNQGGVFRWQANRPTYDSWQPYSLCLPGAVDVRDLVVAPNKELRAATWGRGVWSVRTGP